MMHQCDQLERGLPPIHSDSAFKNWVVARCATQSACRANLLGGVRGVTHVCFFSMHWHHILQFCCCTRGSLRMRQQVLGGPWQVLP